MPTILSALGSTGILLQWDVGCLSSTKAGTVNPLLTAGPPPPLEPAKERIHMLKLALRDKNIIFLLVRILYSGV